MRGESVVKWAFFRSNLRTRRFEEIWFNRSKMIFVRNWFFKGILKSHFARKFRKVSPKIISFKKCTIKSFFGGKVRKNGVLLPRSVVTVVIKRAFGKVERGCRKGLAHKTRFLEVYLKKKTYSFARMLSSNWSQFKEEENQSLIVVKFESLKGPFKIFYFPPIIAVNTKRLLTALAGS